MRGPRSYHIVLTVARPPYRVAMLYGHCLSTNGRHETPVADLEDRMRAERLADELLPLTGAACVRDAHGITVWFGEVREPEAQRATVSVIDDLERALADGYRPRVAPLAVELRPGTMVNVRPDESLEEAVARQTDEWRRRYVVLSRAEVDEHVARLTAPLDGLTADEVERRRREHANAFVDMRAALDRVVSAAERALGTRPPGPLRAAEAELARAALLARALQGRLAR